MTYDFWVYKLMGSLNGSSKSTSFKGYFKIGTMNRI